MPKEPLLVYAVIVAACLFTIAFPLACIMNPTAMIKLLAASPWVFFFGWVPALCVTIAAIKALVKDWKVR